MPRSAVVGQVVFEVSLRDLRPGALAIRRRTWYSSINGETNNFDIYFDFDSTLTLKSYLSVKGLSLNQ